MIAREDAIGAWLARVTWYCEAATVALTVLYCAIVAHDLRVEAEARLSSKSWFQHGFCEWRLAESHLTSHGLCFLVDVGLGLALVRANYLRWQRINYPPLKLALAVSVFNVMHGFGHVCITFMDEDFLESMRPANAPLHVSLPCFLLLSSFLAIGPFIGHMHGVSCTACLAIHLPAMWAFMQYVPLQFAFGAVQLVLNFWVCLPRLAWVRCSGKEAFAERVKHGWVVVSAGVLLLMPVVFAEMLACDSFLKALTGHFLYDCSTLAMSTVYSLAIWRECGCGRRVYADVKPRANSQ